MTNIYKIGKEIYTENQGRQNLPCHPLGDKFVTVPNFYWQKAKFTKREILCLEILCLEFYLQGMTMKEMGKKLYRSHRTIETHIKNIREKLNANSRSEVFSKAKK